jgi:hypothetical protein
VPVRRGSEKSGQRGTQDTAAYFPRLQAASSGKRRACLVCLEEGLEVAFEDLSGSDEPGDLLADKDRKCEQQRREHEGVGHGL